MRAGAFHLVVVVVVVALVEGDGLEVLLLVEPGPPIELVLPDDDVSVLLLVEPGVVLPLLLPLGPPMALELPVPLVPGVLLLLDVEVSRLGAGVVVDELDDDVVGVPV
jgi:hypothetical protein